MCATPQVIREVYCPSCCCFHVEDGQACSRVATQAIAVPSKKRVNVALRKPWDGRTQVRHDRESMGVRALLDAAPVTHRSRSMSARHHSASVHKRSSSLDRRTSASVNAPMWTIEDYENYVRSKTKRQALGSLSHNRYAGLATAATLL